MRGGAGGDVDDGKTDARRTVRTAGDRGEATLGLDQEIVGLAMGIGAVVAITADGAADQRRIVLAQAPQREAELVHRARLEVLNQHIRAGDQVFELLTALPGCEVDDHRILAAIEPDEITALALGRGIVAARNITLGPL